MVLTTVTVAHRSYWVLGIAGVDIGAHPAAAIMAVGITDFTGTADPPARLD